jgi:hypothetical protein
VNKIKMPLVEIGLGGVDLIGLGEDINKRGVLVTEVMNHGVP